MKINLKLEKNRTFLFLSAIYELFKTCFYFIFSFLYFSFKLSEFHLVWFLTSKSVLSTTTLSPSVDFPLFESMLQLRLFVPYKRKMYFKDLRCHSICPMFIDSNSSQICVSDN